MSKHISPVEFTTGATAVKPPAGDIEKLVIRGDLSVLTTEQRTDYYLRLCERMGLDPLLQPFEYLNLQGKLVLYARKACTEQLRVIHGVSVTDIMHERVGDLYVVTAKVANGKGRTDAATGVVSTINLKGDVLANTYMKAETKAKRRATLSICGLGFLDESEIETIPSATREPLKTLPKKDARDIYKKLQDEVRAATSRDDLKLWGEANAERIQKLPEDWQDILRLQYEEMMGDLRQQEGVVSQGDRVIWDEAGERPATSGDVLEPRSVIGNFTKHPTIPTTQKVEVVVDPFNIPPALRRTIPDQSHAKTLPDWMENFAGCEN